MTKKFADRVRKFKTEKTSVPNLKRIASMTVIAGNSAVTKHLIEAGIQSADLTNMYGSEKVLRLINACELRDASKVAKNAHLTACNVVRLLDAGIETITRDELRYTLMNGYDKVKLTDEQRAALHRNTALDAGDTQSNYCLTMLKSCKMVQEVSKNTYKLRDSYVTQLVRAAFFEPTEV